MTNHHSEAQQSSQEQVVSTAPQTHTEKSQRRATLALWLSLLGLVCCPVSIAGLVLGLVALRNLKHYPDQAGKNRAMIAVVVGSAPLWSVVAFILTDIEDTTTPAMKLLHGLGIFMGILLAGIFILAAGAGVATAVIAIKRLTEKSLLRAAEAKAFANPWSVSTKTQKSTAFSPYFPIASGASLLLIIALVVLTPQLLAALAPFKSVIKGDDQESALLISSLIQLLTLPLLATIAFLHYSRYGARSLKYELTFCYALLMMFCSAYATSAFKLWREGLQFSSIGIGLALLFWWTLFIVAQPLAHRLSNRIAEGSRFYTWFYRFQSKLWWFLALFNAPIFILYCLFRFHFVHIASRRPILYFRSFGLKHGSQSFGEIIAKSARRCGVVEALMTPSQRGSDLQASLELTDQAHFMVADNASWQSWVTEKLLTASLAIADVTDTTSASVDWEIQQSILSLGPSRVVILYSGTLSSKRDNVFYLNYDLSRRGRKKARLELSSWLRKALLEVSSQE